MVPGLYYRHSGEFTISGLLAGLLGGILAGTVTGCLYAYGIRHIPFIYANFLLCVVFGSIAGYVPSYLMRCLAVRNTFLFVGVVLVVGLLSFGVSWLVWVYDVLRQDGIDVSLLDLVTHPRGMWHTILLINEKGLWSIGHSNEPFKGEILWFVWMGEAVLFGIGPAAALSLLRVPFCETCQCWYELGTHGGRMAGGEDSEVIRWLENKEFACLKQLGPVGQSTRTWYEFSGHVCPQCGENPTLIVKRCRLQKNNTVKRTRIVKNLLLDKADLSKLQAAFPAAPSTASDAPQVGAADSEVR